MARLVAAVWFAVALGMVARTWLRCAYNVLADWVIDSIDWNL